VTALTNPTSQRLALFPRPPGRGSLPEKGSACHSAGSRGTDSEALWRATSPRGVEGLGKGESRIGI
jgi:hypothetical protein